MRYLVGLTMVMILCSVSHGEERKAFTWSANSSATVRGLSDVVRYDVEGREPLYGVVFEDNNESFIIARVVMDTMTEQAHRWDTVSGKDWKWDGKSIQLSAIMFVADALPSEHISLDWVGQCTYEEADVSSTRYAPKTTSSYNSENWPVETSNGIMKTEMNGASQYDLIKVETIGDIPLNGCDRDELDKSKILWLKGSIDAVGTTTSRLEIEKCLFLAFTGNYRILDVQNSKPGN